MDDQGVWVNYARVLNRARQAEARGAGGSGPNSAAGPRVFPPPARARIKQMIRREGEWWYQASSTGETDRSFDIAFWQPQGPSAIFAAAWELVEESVRIKGGNVNELGLQRTPVTVEPIRG